MVVVKRFSSSYSGDLQRLFSLLCTYVLSDVRSVKIATVGDQSICTVTELDHTNVEYAVNVVGCHQYPRTRNTTIFYKRVT